MALNVMRSNNIRCGLPPTHAYNILRQVWKYRSTGGPRIVIRGEAKIVSGTFADKVKPSRANEVHKVSLLNMHSPCFLGSFLGYFWTYQRTLGNSMLPIWPMTSTGTFRLKPWWIQFPVMRPPIGWNEFPIIFRSDS